MALPSWFLANPAATLALGKTLGRSLPPGVILLLSGDLGSGKTTLVQGMGEGLGIAEVIASPTFALIHEYDQGRLPLYHIDLYRLQPEEVTTLHLETYWQEMPPGIVAIEWPDRLPSWPAAYLHLVWRLPAPSGRLIECQAAPQTPRAWVEALPPSLLAKGEA